MREIANTFIVYNDIHIYIMRLYHIYIYVMRGRPWVKDRVVDPLTRAVRHPGAAEPAPADGSASESGQP